MFVSASTSSAAPDPNHAEQTLNLTDFQTMTAGSCQMVQSAMPGRALYGQTDGCTEEGNSNGLTLEERTNGRARAEKTSGFGKVDTVTDGLNDRKSVVPRLLFTAASEKAMTTGEGKCVITGVVGIHSGAVNASHGAMGSGSNSHATVTQVSRASITCGQNATPCANNATTYANNAPTCASNATTCANNASTWANNATTCANNATTCAAIVSPTEITISSLEIHDFGPGTKTTAKRSVANSSVSSQQLAMIDFQGAGQAFRLEGGRICGLQGGLLPLENDGDGSWKDGQVNGRKEVIESSCHGRRANGISFQSSSSQSAPISSSLASTIFASPTAATSQSKTQAALGIPPPQPHPPLSLIAPTLTGVTGLKQRHDLASPAATVSADVPPVVSRESPSTPTTAAYHSPPYPSTSTSASSLSSASFSSLSSSSSSSFSSPTLCANFDLQDYDVPEISKMVASDWLEADLGMLSSL